MREAKDDRRTWCMDVPVGSMWVMTIFTFRLNVLFFTSVFGPEWGSAIQIPCAGLIAIPTEIYIRYSGRFDWSKVGKSASMKEVADDLQCPFLAISASMNEVADDL